MKQFLTKKPLTALTSKPTWVELLFFF
jgi:hypothetical protein